MKRRGSRRPAASGIRLCAAALLATGLTLAGDRAAGGAILQNQEIVLWPDGMPAPVVPAAPAEETAKNANGFSLRTNISRPRLVVFRPPAGVKASGAGVVVVPGGGFGRLADEHEGSEACTWLARHGAVGFLLLHRTPTTGHAEPNAGPVQDLQKAVLEVRRRAPEFGLDAGKIGVLGFSAGGQVTLVAATNRPGFPGAPEGNGHRPDFLLLAYAWRIYDPATRGLRADIRLDAGLPPTFITQMTDDAASLPQGSTLLYLELVTRKVPAELHIYEKGGHGFGMRSRPGATGPTDWVKRAEDWLRLRGLISGP
ncbi:MAG: alpha/beta hydrolase [Armatimonadetes bacterium]|nr:alpha/beta hydrolase [Armatimonadota bacterium]